MFEDIIVNGITELDKYPSCIVHKYCKQSLREYCLNVPEQKPDIECVNEVKAKVTIESFEVFNTILGPKILVNGINEIKIMYTANNSLQSVHSAHWCIPFCEFILLEDLQYEKVCKGVRTVFAGVEKVCVTYYDKRYVDVTNLFIICPEVEKVRKERCGRVEDCYIDCYSNKTRQYSIGKGSSLHYK